MKIRHTKITAASEVPVKVPAPFDKWYRLASDAEIEEYDGYPARPTPCEEAEGYGIKCLSYAIAKDEFEDQLGFNGLDVVELVTSEWDPNKPMLAYVVGNRVYELDLDEVLRCVGDDVEGSTDIEGAVDTGLEYWYYTKHGLGPGMMPKGVNIVDWYEEGYKTWFKADKMLTTEELNEYEIKEQFPPEGAVTHNGDVIEASCSAEKEVSASECKEVSRDKDSIHYIVASEDDEEEPDWIVDFDLAYLDPEEDERKRIEREIADEEDYYDRLHGEGEYEGDPHDVYGSENAEASTDISAIDLDQLKADLAAGCEEYLTGPKGGFLPSGSPKEDRWDMTADEVYFIDVAEEEGRIKCEVRAELSYDGMIELTEILDPIIAKYDADAYFDMDSPGIAVAYIFDRSIVGSTEIEGASQWDRWNDEMVDRHDRAMIDPPEDDDEELEDISFDVDFDVTVEVNQDGDWDITDDSEGLLDNLEFDVEEAGIKDKEVEEDAEDILQWVIPADPGKYSVKGKLHMEYKPEVNTFGVYKYACDFKDSKVTDLETAPAGKLDIDEKVESSTEVEATETVEASETIEAAMTHEEVEDAIMNDKPFEMDAFKDYIGEDHTNELQANQVEVGDTFRVNTADMIDLGTVVKVISINDPEYRDSYFDYTFRCVVTEVPRISQPSVKVGDEINLWYNTDEYVGELIPV